MALERVKEVLKEKFKELDIKYFLGYMPVGSFAKGTMRDTSDYDIMVFTDAENFESASKELSHVFNRVNDHYFMYHAEKMDILLGLPATSMGKYSVTSAFAEAMGGDVFKEWEPVPLEETLKVSSVCRTPLHVQWFKEANMERKNDDIIKLKEFLDRVNVDIGAYQSELLIYLFDNFNSVLERVSTAEPIYHDFHGRTVEDLRKDPHFKNDYIIITDPVDEKRNAFGKITNDTKFLWDKIVYSADNYLLTGQAITRPLPLGHNYAIEYDVSRFPDKESKFTKLFGIGRRCAGLLKSRRYKAKVVDVNEERALVYVNVEDASPNYIHPGPFVAEEENCRRFKERNEGKEIFEKDGRLYAKKSRPSVEEILKKEPLVKIHYPGFRLSEDYNFEAFDEETLKHLERHLKEEEMGSVFLKDRFSNAKELADFALKHIQDYSGKLMVRELDLPYHIGLDAVVPLSELPKNVVIKRELHDGLLTKKVSINVVYEIKRKLTSHMVIIAGPKESGRHGIYTIYPGLYCPDLTDKKFWKRHAFIKT